VTQAASVAHIHAQIMGNFKKGYATRVRRGSSGAPGALQPGLLAGVRGFADWRLQCGHLCCGMVAALTRRVRCTARRSASGACG
jgi:hypothetical protein